MPRLPAPPELLPLESFCNSAKHLYGQDEFSTLPSARAWLTAQGQAEFISLTGKDLSRLRQAREVIRTFLKHRRDPEALQSLNALLQKVVGAPTVSQDAALAFPRTTSGPVGEILHPILTTLLTHSLTGGGNRLKVCAAPECQWVYYDRSPGVAGQWCDMNICGARHKMRTYRTRKHPPARDSSTIG